MSKDRILERIKVVDELCLAINNGLTEVSKLMLEDPIGEVLIFCIPEPEKWSKPGSEVQFFAAAEFMKDEFNCVICEVKPDGLYHPKHKAVMILEHTGELHNACKAQIRKLFAGDR